MSEKEKESTEAKEGAPPLPASMVPSKKNEKTGTKRKAEEIDEKDSKNGKQDKKLGPKVKASFGIKAAAAAPPSSASSSSASSSKDDAKKPTDSKDALVKSESFHNHNPKTAYMFLLFPNALFKLEEKVVKGKQGSTLFRGVTLRGASFPKFNITGTMNFDLQEDTENPRGADGLPRYTFGLLLSPEQLKRAEEMELEIKAWLKKVLDMGDDAKCNFRLLKKGKLKDEAKAKKEKEAEDKKKPSPYENDPDRYDKVFAVKLWFQKPKGKKVDPVLKSQLKTWSHDHGQFIKLETEDFKGGNRVEVQMALPSVWWNENGYGLKKLTMIVNQLNKNEFGNQGDEASITKGEDNRPLGTTDPPLDS